MFGKAPASLVLTREYSFANYSPYLLGKWCIDYASPVKAIRQLEEIVLPYPFDEEGRLPAAYEYLQKIDKNLFPKLVDLLNQAHQVKHSYRYWRIMVGYWWREFIEIMYERYICIKNASYRLPNAEVKILSAANFVTPYDSKDFCILYKDDLYNHQIYSQIILHLNLFSSVVFSDAEVAALKFDVLPRLSEGWRNRIKQIMCYLSRWNKRYIASTYLLNKHLLRLAIKLRFFPTLDTPRIIVSSDRSVDVTNRPMLMVEGGDEFEQLITKLLPWHLPKIYLEDYRGLASIVTRYFPKRKMHSIVTANAFASNEGFKLFSAKQIEIYRTPLRILQHGGHYGCGAWNSSEDYEKEIADQYLTYGWQDSNQKVVPFIANRLKGNDKKIMGKRDGDMIWVMASFPRYAYTMYSVPVGPQFVDYLNDQAAFLKALPMHMRAQLKARSYRHAYGWSDIEYIRNQTSLVAQTSNLKVSLTKEAKKARLIVCTYNATAHLEMFALNMPTVMYWNPKHWMLRPAAQAIHDKLHEVGILHYDPVKAADHIASIYGHVAEWWQQPNIQQARQEFCRQFATTSEKYTEDWASMLLSEMNH